MVPAIDILCAFVTAIAFSLILVTLFGKKGPGPIAGFLFFFIVLFFSVWAIGIWITPFGPSLWARSWLVFVLVGAIFTLFLAALIPSRPREKVLDLERPEENRAEEAVQTAFGFFFRIPILVLLGAIVMRYLWWIA